jgi:hypothetical protein
MKLVFCEPEKQNTLAELVPTFRGSMKPVFCEPERQNTLAELVPTFRGSMKPDLYMLIRILDPNGTICSSGFKIQELFTCGFQIRRSGSPYSPLHFPNSCALLSFPQSGIRSFSLLN